MPRASLIALALAVCAVALPCLALDPHVDSTIVTGSCSACHRGHGASRSPMLPTPQTEVCLTCHGDQARLESAVREGLIRPDVVPPQLSETLSQPYTHPVSSTAYSRSEIGAVTCTSCHMPHQSFSDRVTLVEEEGRKRSTRDPQRFEYELCEGCHGSGDAATQSLFDISRLFSPNSRSYHPVKAFPRETALSLRPGLAGRQISCTDCHGNRDPSGPRGPHGSVVPYLLRYDYTTVDGSQDSPMTYALCYACHEREAVLESSSFPEHLSHVVEYRASCATCHNAHGSVDNRALIRFGEETFVAGVSPSLTSGRLGFQSSSPGAGACYLTCHGVDHDPMAYGVAIPVPPPGEERPRKRQIRRR